MKDLAETHLKLPIRLGETFLCRTTVTACRIYKLIDHGLFPKLIHFGPSSGFWYLMHTRYYWRSSRCFFILREERESIELGRSGHDRWLKTLWWWWWTRGSRRRRWTWGGLEQEDVVGGGSLFRAVSSPRLLSTFLARSFLPTGFVVETWNDCLSPAYLSGAWTLYRVRTYVICTSLYIRRTLG